MFCGVTRFLNGGWRTDDSPGVRIPVLGTGCHRAFVAAIMDGCVFGKNKLYEFQNGRR
jgi:hypothetical protein